MKDYFLFQADFSELKITEEQLIEKIGGGDKDTILAMQTDLLEVLKIAQERCTPAVTVKLLKPENLSLKDGIIRMKSEFHIGKKLVHYLKGSERIAVFICTIGPALEEWARKLIAEGDVLKGYIADTLGSIAVDQTLHLFQDKFKADLKKQMLHCTNSYSPGYCDWDVSEQHKLFSLMPDHYQDVHLTESALMHPIKSISGFIGVGPNVKFKRFRCDDCHLTSCVYRQGKPR